MHDSQLVDTNELAEEDILCAQEPISTPGTVQQHGALIVLDPARNMTVVAVSDNIAHFLPDESDVEDIALGTELGDRLGHKFRMDLSALLETNEFRNGIPWEISIQVKAGHPELEASIHLQADLILVELEVATFQDIPKTLAATRILQRSIVQLQRSTGDLAELSLIVVRAIRLLTGYERVLIYQFDQEGHGQSLAEDKVPDWQQSLSDQRFHASNIPLQARALYLLAPLRCMWDRDAAPVPLHVDPNWPGSGPTGRAIDLTYAKLRSLSPTHLAIHRALGIDGIMSLSLIQDGRLWGLIVCHHRQPHPTTTGQRAAAMALANAFAVRVGPAERAQIEQARRADAQRLSMLLANMAAAEDAGVALTTGKITIASLFNAAGAAVLHDGKTLLVGTTPPEAAVLDLAHWLHDHAGEAFHTDRLPSLYPKWLPYAPIACGVIAVFLAADRSEMLLWFRRAEKPLVDSDSTLRPEQAAALAQQASFTRVSEPRHAFAKPWATWEPEIAAALGHAVTEVILRSLRRISELSEQLRQSQKMEAIGQLTGGIAHDFNNMLAGIIGSLEMTKMRITQGRVTEVDRYIDAAMTSAQRAAAMTHRLLAFSRRQTLDPKPTDVNKLIIAMGELIRSTVGSGIHVEVVTSGGLWKTLCDFNQLESAVLNLALNARDAMSNSGRLTIEVGNVRLDDLYARHYGIAAGQYVALSITDTGLGMAPSVISRAFEPFFTTKPQGHGTGLGLSMVYGFVTQSEGYVRIYSELGVGTTVRLYLPRWFGTEAEQIDDNEPAGLQTRHNRTILVVDDEPVVLMLVGDTLRDLGYTIIEARDGAEALRLWAKHREFDLVITDVGLPGGLNGRQLADALRVGTPDLPVLFITGYAENAALGNGTLDHGMEVITKPFALVDLAAKVKAMTP